MPAGGEKYQANRGEDYNNDKLQASDSSKKLMDVGTKAVAGKYGGKAGSTAFNALSNTKPGQKALELAALSNDHNPIFKKAAEILDKSGALDAVDKIVNEEADSESDKDELKSDNKDDEEKKSDKSHSDDNKKSDKSKAIDIKEDIIEGNLKKKLIIIAVIAAFALVFIIFTGFFIILSGSDENGKDPADESNNQIVDANGALCLYDIKGFSNGSTIIKRNINISNLMVRLMECGSPFGNGSYSTPINQGLVDFESYIAGVAYAEIGPSAPAEALKSQMVAARSYALSRPAMMGNSLGKKLEQENGQWILQISSCVADQVFCNIDEGCSYMGGGDGQGGVVRSGKVPGAVKTRDPLPQDAPLRAYAKETEGEVLVDANGYILASGFVNTDQDRFSALANNGFNYKQILMQHYNQGSRNIGANNIVKMSCQSYGINQGASTGSFSKWKQGDSSWNTIPIGQTSSNVGSAGCLATSVSMLIAKSGVETNIKPFNPGTFVQTLNSNGGFDGSNFVWRKATEIAPRFVFQNLETIEGLSRQQKFEKIKGLLEQGNYIAAEVKGSTGQHWVAIDGISGNDILMMDPASNNTIMWDQYNPDNTRYIGYYKVS